MFIPTFLLASTLSLAVSGASAAAAADSAGFVPGRFIVEYQPELTKRSVLTAIDPHEAFHQALAAIQPAGGVNSHFNYSSPLFTGASFSIHESPDAIARLKSLPNILNIWPVKRFEILQSGDADAKQNFESRNWNPHAHTGVAALHAQGLSGQNITIGVIDTGVDYTHPALGGGIGPDYKIVGGYNFVGPLAGASNNNKLGTSNSRIDEYNPLDCQGHGTHVAGIIAAKNDRNLVGVAPNATIRAYKIFGCSGGTSEDVVIAAFQTAFRDGVDIITASVGLNGQGLLDGPANLIASRLVEYGVFVAVAAGNSGVEGPRYPSSPGAGEYVTAVGSAESNAIVTWTGTARSSSGDSITFKYVTSRGVLPSISNTTFSVDFLAENADDCAALTSRAATGSALILPLSSACEKTNLYTAVEANGYKVMLRYTDKPLKYSVPTYTVQGFEIDVFGTVSGLGDWARNQTQAGHNLTIILDTLAAQPDVVETDSPLSVRAFGPIYQGKILITGDNGDVLGVPYIGTLLGTDKNSPAPYGTWSTDADRPRIYGFEVTSGNSFEVTNSENLTQVISSVTTTPQLVFGLADAASYLTFGLVDADFSLKSHFRAPFVPNQAGFINHLSASTFDDGFPSAFIGRSTNDVVIPLKLFSNGSTIPSGSYRVVGALLPAPYRPEVNATENWVTYLSAPFQYINEESNLNNTHSSSLNTSAGNILFRENTVTSAASGASYLESPYDPVEVSIQLHGSKITNGTTAEIGLPRELTGIPSEIIGWNRKFDNLANITILPPANNSSGSTAKIVFTKHVETRDLEGTLTLYARLKNPEKYASGGAHRVFFDFTDVNGVSYSSLTIGSTPGNYLTPALKVNEPLGGNTDIKVLEITIPSQKWTRSKVTYILPDDTKFDADLLASDAQLLQINTPAESVIKSNVSFSYNLTEPGELSVDIVVNSGEPSTVRLAVPVPAAQFKPNRFNQFQATVNLNTTASSLTDVVYNLRAMLADSLPIYQQEVTFRGTDFLFVNAAYLTKSFENIPFYAETYHAQFWNGPYYRKEAEAQFWRGPYDRKEAQAQFWDRPFELKNAEAQFWRGPYDRKEAEAQFWDRPFELKNAEAQFWRGPYDRKEAEAQFWDRPFELKNAEAQFWRGPYDRKEAEAQFWRGPYDRKEAQAQFWDRPFELKNAEAQFWRGPYDRKEAEAQFWRGPYDRKEAQAQFWDRPFELKNAEAQFWRGPYDRKEAEAQFWDRPFELKNAEAQFWRGPYDRKEAEAQFWRGPYDRKEAQAQFWDRPFELKNAEAQFWRGPYDRKEAEAQFWDRPFELKNAEAQFWRGPYDRKEAEAQFWDRPFELKNAEAQFWRGPYDRKEAEAQFWDRPFELKNAEAQFWRGPYDRKEAEAQFWRGPYDRKEAEAQFWRGPYDRKEAEAQFWDRPFELKNTEAQFWDRPFELKGNTENVKAQFGQPYYRKDAKAQFWDRPFELKGNTENAKAQFWDRPFELKGNTENVKAQFGQPYYRKDAKAQFWDRPFELKGNTENVKAQFGQPYYRKDAKAQFWDRPFELKGNADNVKAQFGQPYYRKDAEAQFWDRPFELKGNTENAKAQFWDRPFELKGNTENAKAQFWDRPFELKGNTENVKAQFGQPYYRKDAEAQFWDRPFELKGNTENVKAQFGQPYYRKDAKAQFWDRPFELKGNADNVKAQFGQPYYRKDAEAQFWDRPFELKGSESPKAESFNAQFGQPYDRKDAIKFGTAGASYYYYKDADRVGKEAYLAKDSEALGFGAEWFQN